MPKKPRKPASPVVVSLADARARREVDKTVAEINKLARGMTESVKGIVDIYHAWEQAHPDDAVRPADKVEMISLGFVGRTGFFRCHEEHRLPVVALVGAQAEWAYVDDEELAEEVMCPALESGRCERVLKAITIPPCILLGGEVEGALGGGVHSGLGGAVLGGYRDPPAAEKKRFARARALVRKHDKLEQEAMDRMRSERDPGRKE